MIGALLLLLGVTTGLFPHAPSLPVLYTLAFFAGIGGGAIDTGGVDFSVQGLFFCHGLCTYRSSQSCIFFTSTLTISGGQVLLLNIWRDGDSGPYMHALHFMFGMGAFLAPVIGECTFNIPINLLHEQCD